MKKNFGILNAFLFTITLILCVVYDEKGGIVLKGITSSSFVLTGLVNLIYGIINKTKTLRFPVMMFLGLFFSMIGDIVLNINFMTGALIFALGHIMYFSAYCALDKFEAKTLIPTAIIFIASAGLINLVPIFDFGSPLMQWICTFYALVISFMLGKAVWSVIKNNSIVNIILVVGSILFYFSDLMLVFNIFGGAPQITDTLCLYTYFPGQAILAFSVYKFSNSK